MKIVAMVVLVIVALVSSAEAAKVVPSTKIGGKSKIDATAIQSDVRVVFSTDVVLYQAGPMKTWSDRIDVTPTWKKYFPAEQADIVIEVVEHTFTWRTNGCGATHLYNTRALVKIGGKTYTIRSSGAAEAALAYTLAHRQALEESLNDLSYKVQEIRDRLANKDQ
jgi:opacity protein-like surface antigen